MSLESFISSCSENLQSRNIPEVEEAHQYLLSRNLLDSTIKSVILGYCDKDLQIPDAIRFFGAERIEDRWDMSYKINGHIIVPVFSEFNKLVGFATRRPTSEKGNTWWNLPLPFEKGSHLFLLNIAKKNIFEKNKIYLVEGYMDAIILRQYGLKNVVGLMGTALSSRKISLIARYCNNVCLCFDTDENEAGQKANDISIAILKKFDFCENISAIKLPLKQDPDEYVAKNGLENFLAQEAILKESEIEKICRRVLKQKHGKEVFNAQ